LEIEYIREKYIDGKRWILREDIELQERPPKVASGSRKVHPH